MMRRWLNSPILSLLSLAALAVWPILRAGYLTIGDGLIHLYRLVQFDALLQQGVWFPRWASDLCYGYGCPVFNFYPPLTYYAGAAFHALGLSYAHSLLAVYALAFTLAIGGAYALGKELWENDSAGIVAAAAYGLAPYLYFNALARGALPELIGLGLLPWALWAYVRLARRPSPHTFLTAALIYAALILTHLLGALLAAPVMFVFGFIAHFTNQAQGAGRKAFRLLLRVAVFCLSLALAAYFLLPAVLETSAVQIFQLTAPGDLNFRNNFLSPDVLLAWPRPFDAKLVFVSVPPSLSLAALAIALIGLIARARRLESRGWRLEIWIWILGFGISLFTLPLTQPLWELLPLANIIQFPWRLVGPASLLLALLAARAFLNLESWNLNLALRLLPSAFWLFSLPWTFSASPVAPNAPTVRDLTSYELATGQLGTTATGEFLPAAVRELPMPAAQRLGPLPEGATLIEQSSTATAARATISASAPITLTFNIFDFPGWQATVDGPPTPITPSVPHGLITVPVSAGTHTVEVRFGDTPLRRVAQLISIVAMVITGVLVLKGRRSGGLENSTQSPIPQFSTLPLLSLTWLCLRVLLIDNRETVFARTRFDGAVISGVEQTLDVNFDNQLILLGTDGLTASLAADNHLSLSLYWRAQNPPAADYSASVQVVDGLGNIFGQSDSQHPGRVPTSRWRLDQYAQDEHTLTLLPGTPPGTYTFTVSLYQPDGSGLNVLDENLIPQGQSFVLGNLTVTRATHPPETLDAAQTFNLPLGPLTLIGATFNTTAPQAGDELHATLFWRESPILQSSKLKLILLAADGTLLREQTYPYFGGAEVVRQPVRLRIPASAPAGPAELRLQLVGVEGNPQTIATLDIQVPLRSFSVPAITFPRGDDFGSSIKLLGYDFTPEGITLYWQAMAEIETSYTVFVHALSAEGRVTAQSDAVPMNGARPTTGWLTGEVIADPHALSLSGAAKIEIGLYDPQTNARLGVIVIAP